MSCCEDAERSSILLHLLRGGAGGGGGGGAAGVAGAGCCRDQGQPQRCSCPPGGGLVALRTPHLAFKAAWQVLQKTLLFVRNVPCFGALPGPVQRRLLLHSWAPLLLLGLGLDRQPLALHTLETRRHSLLHSILTVASGDRRPRAPGVPAGAAEGIRLCLERCRALNISGRESAFLKGALLFTPEASEPDCADYVRALRLEAERALCQHVRSARRLSSLQGALGALRAVDPDAVAGLLLRPVTGTGSVEQHVLAMFYQTEERSICLSLRG